MIRTYRAARPNVELTLLELTSVEQIAAGSVLRRDEDVAADILAMLNANRAFDPYTAGINVTVVDGDVLLEGRLPSARIRASIEQDVWHVQGVFAVHNELRVNGG